MPAPAPHWQLRTTTPHEPRTLQQTRRIIFPKTQLTQREFSSILSPPHAAVAQLDRASDYGSEGLGFESLRLRLVSQRPKAAVGNENAVRPPVRQSSDIPSCAPANMWVLPQQNNPYGCATDYQWFTLKRLPPSAAESIENRRNFYTGACLQRRTGRLFLRSRFGMGVIKSG